MLPALPSKTNPELNQLVVDVIRSSAALGRGIHPLVLEEIAQFMTKVNSYYTNAMEGNPTRLRDIEAALHKHLSKEKSVRDFQLEHVAHVRVQEEMMRRLRNEPGLRICSRGFLCWLHEQFYLRLPPDMRFAKTMGGRLVPVEPGRLRGGGITVGAHDAPEKEGDIVSHLDKLEEFLSPEELVGPDKVLGMASSHHRFLWIHPFPDGNGRVARLLTTAFGVRIGVGENLLWTVARAFASRRREYDDHLAGADQPRKNDWDGRGPLSEEGLTRFCAFFLTCCLDQILFMNQMLKLEDLERRYMGFVGGLSNEKRVSKAGRKVMERLFARGNIARSEIISVCGVKRRRATQIIRELLDGKLVRSETPYGDLKLNLSVDMAAVLFPGLV